MGSRLLSVNVTQPIVALVAMFVIVALAGCEGQSRSPRRGGSGTSGVGKNELAGILVGTMETLFSLEQYEFGQAEQLVMSRLNQWIRGQEVKIPWQREPRLDALPQKLTSTRGVRSLDDDAFLYEHDFAMLRDAVWMHRIAAFVREQMNKEASPSRQPSQNAAESARSPLQFVSPDDPEELRLAMRLFDWTVRHVQLEEDAWPETSPYKLPRHWHTPYETVLLGRGTASDRAWVFMLLARQQGLDVVMLGLENPQTSSDSDKADAETPANTKPWIPALVLAGAVGDAKTTELYLFDPALGLPIPGPNGRGIATLSQVAADDALLRQLDLDDKRPYPVKAEQLQKVAVLAEASPGYLSRRMKFLESRLGGQQRIVLTTSPQAIEDKLKTAQHVEAKVAIWSRPYQTLQLRETEDEKLLNAARAELYPLEGLLRSIDDSAADRKAVARREDAPEWSDSSGRRPARSRVRVALGVGRMMQLAGNYDHEAGAVRFLQQAMASQDDQAELMQAFEDDLRAQWPRPNDPAAPQQIKELAARRVAEFRRADEAAKLWLGQIKAADGELETALNYFTRWQSLVWQPSLNYSRARVYEVQGKLADAIQLYREDDSPQRTGNLLRARRLESLLDTN